MVYTAALQFSPPNTTLYQAFHDTRSHDSIFHSFGHPWSTLLLVLVQSAWSDSTILSAVFSLDGACLVSGSFSGKIQVWDTASGAEILPASRRHDGWIHSVDISLDGSRIVSGSQDRTIRIWNMNPREATLILLGHEEAVLSVAFSVDGTRIVSGSRDATIRIWSAASGLDLQVIPVAGGCFNDIWAVAFSADGYRIASGCGGTVRVWDIDSGTECLPPLRGHESRVDSVAFSSDGTLIISGSHQNYRIWDASFGHQRSSIDESFPSFSSHTKDGWIIDSATQKKLCQIPSTIKNKSWLLGKLRVKHWFYTLHRDSSPTSYQAAAIAE